jgi:hypothetical protein
LDETSKQRLYYGNWEFDDDPARLINYESILDLWRNEYVPEGQKYITADVARFGSDKGVLILWSGYRVLDIITLDHFSVTNTAQRIKDLANLHQVPNKNIIADEDGVGGGVVDIVGCKGFVNGSKPLDEERKSVQYTNLKTQCYFKLAEKINNGEIYLTKPFSDISEKLIQELEQVKRDKIDQDGKLILMSKEKVKEAIGRSPDFSDAMMMRLWFDLGVKFNFSI